MFTGMNQVALVMDVYQLDGLLVSTLAWYSNGRGMCANRRQCYSKNVIKSVSNESYHLKTGVEVSPKTSCF
jgi:hypothetical protein